MKDKRDFTITKGGYKVYICMVNGCKKKVKNNKVCLQHGATRNKCKIVDCNNNRINNGLCLKHGANLKKCNIDDCKNIVVNSGLCNKHGAVRTRCKILNCLNRSRQGGLCSKHGAVRPKCTADGCENRRVNNGVCVKHGANVKKRICKIDNCELRVDKEGYCTKHHPDYVPLNNISKGAKAVLDYLLDIKVQFICEKRFNDCRYKNTLPFDFYLPQHNLLIEYDGRQHFEPIKHFGGLKSFKLRQKRDAIKNQYAKDNNIKLLRIPHTTKLSDIPDLINKIIHE